MITQPLTFRYNERPLRDACAWHVPSEDPRAWLEFAARGGMNQTTVRLMPLPRSSIDRAVMGALIVGVAARSNLPACEGSDGKPEASPAIPFGCVASRLYLPVEAAVSPDLDDDEWKTLLSDDYVYVWHPRAGLVAFEPRDILSVADLITCAPPQERRWNRAEPGVALAPRLTSLRPVESQSFEVILQQGKDDIGSKSEEAPDLPRSPEEPPRGLLNEAARQGQRAIANFVRSLTNMAPATSDGRTWVNDIQDWADRKLQDLQSGWNAERHKAISRLLHMLKTDPDRGLQYALPTGGGAHRGLGRSGNSLTPRSVDFSLGGLGGGKAADFWNLPYEMQRRLTELYHQLANREMNLGRHRRAAYIFAELLGDLHAAAGALKAGRHWREAAVLYMTKLNQPLQGAECLEEGGLWSDAVEQYEKLEEFERAGDLLLRLEQTDDAAIQYRRAVDKLRAAEDRLGAALLLENKLQAADEAIDELAAGWPHSRQAVQCLRAHFEALGRHGRHHDARSRVKAFRDSPLPDHHCLELVEIVGDTATKYPNQIVKAEAADCTRVLVSRALPSATRADTRRLLGAITKLVPEDRLLGRDCSRYVDQRPTPPAPRVQPRQRARLLRTIELPTAIEWRAAAHGGAAIFIVGARSNQLVLQRCSWEAADRQAPPWRLLSPGAPPIVLAANDSRDGFVLVHAIGERALPQRLIPASSICFGDTRAGAIAGMSSGVLGAAMSNGPVTWLLQSRESEFVLTALDQRGAPVNSRVAPPFAGCVLPLPMLERNGAIYLASDRALLVLGKNNEVETIECGRQIASLVASATHTRLRIAVGFERGGEMIWRSKINGDHRETFAADIDNPVICINRGGYLIAAGEGVCEIYNSQERKLTFETTFTSPDLDPIAVLPSPISNHFAIVTRKKGVLVYEVS